MRTKVDGAGAWRLLCVTCKPFSLLDMEHLINCERYIGDYVENRGLVEPLPVRHEDPEILFSSH
jgi:hypothetical protein